MIELETEETLNFMEYCSEKFYERYNNKCVINFEVVKIETHNL